MLIVIVHGPVPVIDAIDAVAPASGETLTNPGFKLFEFCGVVQSAGITIVAIEFKGNWLPAPALKVKVNELPVEFAHVLVGEMVSTPSPSFATPSVNITSACNPELNPSAVALKVEPRQSSSHTCQVVTKLP